eukprot:CAMPEP_0169427938 /NCGR_PEP_ID=MMETSP1042-20121227/1054_1 /TAXON_ID=464988 /ORGANISM="Hemiselmis andersenii, Strain CCMP1180" /LENGTH=1434 /DNA_ID=CAMNT_0009538063 /DNA_START=72 /DNA_END=4372 /DNA_ORIENTATION=+
MPDWVRLPENGSAPVGVSGSAAVTIQETLYVFGGSYEAEDGSGLVFSSDLHAYDTETGFWTKKMPSKLQACARSGHCMVAVGSSLYIICGRTLMDEDTVFLGDVFVYDTIDQIWSPVRTAGPNPVGRAHATACYLRGSIYLFGGCNGTVASSYRNDLMILNLESLTWTKCEPTTRDRPVGRAQHTMVSSGGLLYVFGGGNLRHGNKNALGDLQAFDPVERKWTVVTSEESTDTTPPEPRWGHCMCEVRLGLFIFAGVGPAGAEGEERFFDSLWVFNTVSKSWYKLSSGGGIEDESNSMNEFAVIMQRPSPRAGMAMTVLDSEVVIFGGYYTAPYAEQSQYMFDLYSFEAQLWRKELPLEEVAKEHAVSDFSGRALNRGTRQHGRRSNKGPLAEYGSLRGSQMVSLDVNKGGEAGGAEAAKSVKWDLHIIEGLVHPPPRSGSAMASWYTKVYMLGGLAEVRGKREYVNDMWVLDLHSLEWEQLPQRAAPGGEDGDEIHSIPCGRAGHNMVALQDGDGAAGRHEAFQLWCLFGWCMKEAKPAFLDDVSRYEPSTGTWTTQHPQGSQPPPRSYASCVNFRGCVYVFGGCNGSLASNFRSDLWILEVQDNYWERVVLPSGTVPPPGRSQHAMVQYGGTLYMFGGNNKVGGKRNLLSDFYSFDPVKLRWTQLTDGATGEGPGKRSGHAMSMVNGGIFLFGGGGEGDQSFLDSLWVYDTATRRWHMLGQEDEGGNVGSKRPCGRAAHCMFASGSSIYVATGLTADGTKGIHSLGDVASFDAATWRQCVPKVVSQRYRQASTRLLAKLQGLEDHASTRLLESLMVFKGKARDVYNDLLNDPFAKADPNEEGSQSTESGVYLAPEVSAQMSALGSRIDTIMNRVDKKRALAHRMQRVVTLGPVLSKGGVLHVEVVRARDLPKMDRFGKSDPYVVLEMEGRIQKTTIKKRTLNPTWRESFVLSVADSNSNLVVTAYDWDFADAHDLMGFFTVSVNELLDIDGTDQFYTLRDGDGYPAQGSIQLRLSYRAADSETRNMRNAVATALHQLPARDAFDVVSGFTGGAVGGPVGGPSATEKGAVTGELGRRKKAGEMLSDAERAVVQQVREDNLQDMELSKREELQAEARATKLRELDRLRRLQEEVEERETKKEEIQRAEEEMTQRLKFMASLSHEKPRPAFIPTVPGALKIALEGGEGKESVSVNEESAEAGAVEGASGGIELSARLLSIEAKRKLRDKLMSHKRGQRKEVTVLDPKLKERQMQTQVEVEEAMKREREREKERQHATEMQRKKLMMEQEARSLRKLHERREEGIARRQQAEEEKARQLAHEKAELEKKRNQRVLEVTQRNEALQAERKQKLRMGFRQSTAGSSRSPLASLGGKRSTSPPRSPPEFLSGRVPQPPAEPAYGAQTARDSRPVRPFPPSGGGGGSQTAREVGWGGGEG